MPLTRSVALVVNAALPAEMRGLALDEVARVRSAHNSFARPEPFVAEEKNTRAVADDEACVARVSIQFCHGILIHRFTSSQLPFHYVLSHQWRDL